MAKVIITITDGKKDKVDIRAEFDPPIDAKKNCNNTQSQNLGLIALDAITKAGTVESVKKVK